MSGRPAGVEARRVRRANIARERLRIADELPIAARHDELLAAIADHQVVIVAGETGSGKSTQLPKLCLELGRGVDGLIGHTQPRRVAARTIAERVADELGTPLGDAVGYSVRFDDRVRDGTLVRVMTDGILLAELPRDRQLRRYDTLIIDEAHERSLNIDFLLGYLRRLLPQRPDLKVIVTSATIDTERFAAAFATSRGGEAAPVIEVTGRTYPVEVRYRPIDVHLDGGQDEAIGDAVDELTAQGPGDVLVFLSGEREIHDAAEALRRRFPTGTEVLPLYARLSAAEQHRIFQPHPGRRIVLSTNVAETSITVPGVRYVVDTGVARVSRYSRRLKVQRLPIEPISQASADQRAGRCGRLGPGVCIRLYAEDDYDGRPEFTEPELLRTNLASVILQMLALDLGDVASFPFIEPPDTAAVRDGFALLEELGAISSGEDERRLTGTGRRLARLPVDPRVGRMVLEAGRRGCVHDVLVIAAALSMRDARERPAERQAEADELHRRFDVAGSDLLSIVALWTYLREQQRRLSGNQFRKLCRSEHLNFLRVREWQDLFSQLRRVAGELGLTVTAEAARPDDVHQAVLAGLLSHVGMRDDDGRQFRGARGSSFVIAPGSVLTRRPSRWVMAAELVETDRLRARRVAAISPDWIERLAGHLVKRSHGEPWWDADRAAAVTTETVTLYGLPIVTGRVVLLDRIDRPTARAMFVRHGLVDEEWDGRPAFLLDRNRRFRDGVRAMEAKARRAGLLDDDAVEDFYDERLPADVTSGRRFERWWRDAAERRPGLLDLTDDLVGGGAVRWSDYPDVWRQGDLALPLTYRFAPGEPLDGVTVHVPLTLLNRVMSDGFDWQVPGYRRELVEALVRTLPKDLRRRLIPMAETVAAALERLGPSIGRLVDALANALGAVAGTDVPAQAFRPAAVPAHLRVNFVVADTAGAVLDADDDLGAIKRRLAARARVAVAAASPITERRGIREWDVGDLPIVVEAKDGSGARGYPALVDDGDGVSLRVLTTAEAQGRGMRAGVRRLLVLTSAPSAASVRRGLDRARQSKVGAAGVPLDELAADAVLAATDAVLDDIGALPWDPDAFAALQRAVRERAPALAGQALATGVDVIAAEVAVRTRLAGLTAPAARAVVQDAQRHLGRLVRPGFVTSVGVLRLPDVLRYVRGIDHRLERLDVTRDARRRAEVVALEQRYERLVGRLDGAPVPAALDEVRWLLEELRVSVFAQSLGTRTPVSPTRVAKALAALDDAF